MSREGRLLLAKRLRLLRQRHRYTQQAVAERARLDYKYYQSIEGKRPPNVTFDSLERLAKAFGISLSELLKL
jgi:transcriptional regulator with XRE-family HTH domain